MLSELSRLQPVLRSCASDELLCRMCCLYCGCASDELLCRMCCLYCGCAQHMQMDWSCRSC